MAEGSQVVSVVVPAHNEAPVIGRLLGALQPGIDDGLLEVVVVANGCTDDTAQRASAFPVTVIDRAEPGKPGALNAGDAAATAFPRFYVDADIVLSAADLAVLAAALDGPTLAVAPARTMDVSKSSWIVRSYTRIWERLESTVDSLAGRGCYGVSAAGRARWGEFPDLVADDGFVNTRFEPDERVTVAQVESIVVAPRDLRSLLQRKRRSHRGNVELEGQGLSVTSSTGWLKTIRESPRLVVHAPAYVLVSVLARLGARRDLAAGATSWGSDESSRG